MGASGTFTTPFFPANYSNNLNCVWTINVPPGNRLVLSFPRDFALGSGDSFTFSVGASTSTITDAGFPSGGDDDEPSYYDEFVNQDNGNFYDYLNKRRFYYYYDGRRRRDDDDGPISVRSRSRQVVIQGSNQPIMIQFISDASGTAPGISVTFTDERSPDTSGESGSESSDEEEL